MNESRQLLFVIASAAQPRAAIHLEFQLDCFVALLLAMTGK